MFRQATPKNINKYESRYGAITFRNVNAAHLSSSCDPEASISPRKQFRSNSQYNSCLLKP